MVVDSPISWCVCHVNEDCVRRYELDCNILVNWFVFEDLVISTCVAVQLIISVTIPVFLVFSVNSVCMTGVVEGSDLFLGLYCCCPVAKTLSEFV